MCHQKSSLPTFELSAGGAKWAAWYALPVVGRLWPSADDANDVEADGDDDADEDDDVSMEWAVQLWQCNAASLSLVRPYKQWEDVNNKFAFFFFRKMPPFIVDLGWLASDRKSTYTSFAFHSVHFIGRNENPSVMKM